MKRLIVSCLLAWVSACSIVSAQVSITEIMYDLEGSDSGREWLEIFNGSSAGIDLSSWRLFENGTNHTLTEFSGGATVPASSYAVIADNAQKFLEDHPSFSGILFDSAFSLSQTGETLILRDGGLADRDTVAYDPAGGGAGDGMSLYKTASGWAAASPTPGGAPLGSGGGGGTSSATSSASGAAAPPSSSAGAGAVEPMIRVSITRHTPAPAVGTVAAFHALATGVKGEPLARVRYLWSFGDGTRAEGEQVQHTYVYPGRYAVIVDVASDKYAASDRVTVEAVAAHVAITALGGNDDPFVQLSNPGRYEVDLSGWMIRTAMGYAIIPHGTVILPGSTLKLGPLVTGFTGEVLNDGAELLYPNGEGAGAYRPVSLAPLAHAVPQSAPRMAAPSLAPHEQTSPQNRAILPETAEVSTSGAAPAMAGAAPDAATKNFLSGILPWAAGTLVLIFVAVAGVLVLRTERSAAEAFTIIEDDADK